MRERAKMAVRVSTIIPLCAALFALQGCSEEQKAKWEGAGKEAKEAASAVGEAIKETAKDARQGVQAAVEDARPADPDTMARKGG